MKLSELFKDRFSDDIILDDDELDFQVIEVL